MISEHKIQDILKYVWSTQADLKMNIKHLNDITHSIIKLLDQDSDTSAISGFLQNISLDHFSGKISTDKCDQTASLIMNWYSPIPPIYTDYGRVKFRYYYIKYKNKVKDLTIHFKMTMNNEAVLYPDEIPLDEEEKQQLITAIISLIPDKLLIYNNITEEYISKHLIDYD